MNARRAAAAAVSATLSAAAVTIVVDGQHAAMLASAARTPARPTMSPSAMDSSMPLSVERPTGAHPAYTHAAPAQQPDARTIDARAIEARSTASTAGAVGADRPALTAAPRPGLAIGRRWAATAGSATLTRRPVPASIGDLHLSEATARRVHTDRPARTGEPGQDQARETVERGQSDRDRSIGPRDR